MRAVAVIVILFFHAGYGWARGGFIGVDVFFVISGYLITRNIAYELQEGEFSFAAFYKRRIRRLFPALLFTSAAILAAAIWLFSPTDLKRLGNSLLYTILSVSNFFFWGEVDYFNAASEFKPLLHTWSLAIEEQFYLIWPALLVGLFWFKKRYIGIGFFIVSIVLSLYLSQSFIEKQPETVFFLLPFRVFEFSIGALCLWLDEVKPKLRVIKEFYTVLGLALILWSAFAYSELTVFPGLSALIPCIGAALVIYAGKSYVSNIFLSNRIAVGLGLISYSLYLVHWPLFVFYKYWKFTQITAIENIILLLLSIAIAYLMWRFIEQPFRYKKGSRHSDIMLFWFAAAALVLSFVSANVWGHNGWPSRFPSEYFLSEKELTANRERYIHAVKKDSDILSVRDANQKNVIVMGNSHSIDLIYALRENGSRINITHLPTSYLCYNFGTPILEKNKKLCHTKLQTNLADEHWARADAVYLHDHWPKLNAEDLGKRLNEIRRITKAPIYVFGPKMIYRKPVPQIVLSHLRMSSINTYSKAFEKKERIITNNAIRKMINNTNIKDVYYVDVLRTQCGDSMDECGIVSDLNHKFLYFDYSHFTLQGAREFGKRLKTKYPQVF